MASLPVQIDPGAPAELPPAGMTPLRLGLVLAWVAAFIAFAAVGLSGWSLIGLSERRNTSVRTYLTGRGIPAARISSQAFGESMPRVPTADGVRELQNRRVEITYGPGSGR